MKYDLSIFIFSSGSCHILINDSKYAPLCPCQSVLEWVFVKLLMKCFTPAWLRCRSSELSEGRGALWRQRIIHKVVNCTYSMLCLPKLAQWEVYAWFSMGIRVHIGMMGRRWGMHENLTLNTNNTLKRKYGKARFWSKWAQYCLQWIEMNE